jgi:hypothetical protein
VTSRLPCLVYGNSFTASIICKWFQLSVYQYWSLSGNLFIWTYIQLHTVKLWVWCEFSGKATVPVDSSTFIVSFHIHKIAGPILWEDDMDIWFPVGYKEGRQEWHISLFPCCLAILSYILLTLSLSLPSVDLIAKLVKLWLLLMCIKL